MHLGTRLILPLSLLIMLLACSSDECPDIDTQSPAAVTDLRVEGIGTTYVDLAWTATGDDGTSGVASEYDIRYARKFILASQWDGLDRCDSVPEPSAAGTVETFRVSRLTPKTTFYFALRVADEEGNWSDISNVVAATAAGHDTIPPAPVTDLRAEALNHTSVRLTWTATGDDSLHGTAAVYDIRHSLSMLDAGTWSQARQLEDEQAPHESASPETLIVAGLTPDAEHYFAMKVVDEALNWSSLSNVASGVTPDWPDTTPPATVDDLEVAIHDAESVRLRWTAPGDDGHEGVAEQYDIRSHPSPIDVSNWDIATEVEGEPDPSLAGTLQEIMIGGFETAGRIYFGIRTRDEYPNWSDISNVVTVEMANCPWGAPSAFHPVQVWEIDPGEVMMYWKINWTFGWYPDTYEIRYSRSPIDDWNWKMARLCPGQPKETIVSTHWSDYHYRIENLAPATTYHIGIRGSAGGCETPVILYSVTTDPPMK